MKRRARPVTSNKQELAVVPEEEETLITQTHQLPHPAEPITQSSVHLTVRDQNPQNPQNRTLKIDPDDNNTAAGTSAGHERDRWQNTQNTRNKIWTRHPHSAAERPIDLYFYIIFIYIFGLYILLWFISLKNKTAAKAARMRSAVSQSADWSAQQNPITSVIISSATVSLILITLQFTNNIWKCQWYW